MDLKIIAGVITLSTAALIFGLLIPTEPQNNVHALPWQVELTANGDTRVFGLIMGQSTLLQAEKEFQTQSKISLFDTPDETRVVEAYFDKVILGGLSAKIVMVMNLDSDQLQLMFERGTRISTLGSGTHKVNLHEEDLNIVRQSKISSITYIPRVRLEKETIVNRFGKPEQSIAEVHTGTIHWLYPNLGLDISTSVKGNAVLQYVSPKDFSLLVQPLLEHEKL